jgi:hypothetical protein
MFNERAFRAARCTKAPTAITPRTYVVWDSSQLPQFFCMVYRHMLLEHVGLQGKPGQSVTALGDSALARTSPGHALASGGTAC